MSEDTGGQRLREIRLWRRKSLRVVAELAGISESHLSNLEAGRRTLDRRGLVIALAKALDVSPAELGAPPAPGRGPNVGSTGAAIQDVRRVLLAADLGDTGGEVVPLPALRDRCVQVLRARQQCQDVQVGTALPQLLADLHTTTAQDRDALRWLVLVSVHAGQAWLRDVGAPLELGWRAAVHAQHAAERLGDPQVAAVAAFGVVRDLVVAGSLDLAARRTAEAIDGLDTAGPDGQQLTAIMALSSAMTAASGGRRGDIDAPAREAAELAERTGASNRWWFDFSPANVTIWRMGIALEDGDAAGAATYAEAAEPAQLVARSRRSAYWSEYGRAMAQLRGRVDQATQALRTAEDIYPARVRRSPFVRETVLNLLPRARTDAASRELRGMAYRMGLSA